MARRRLVSAEIWAGHYGAPLDEREIARHYTLTGDDLEIVGRRRGDATRLGYAMLLLYMRWPGRALEAGEVPPAPVLAYVAQQLGVAPEAFADYAHRDQTRREHLVEIRRSHGFRIFDRNAFREVVAFSVPIAQTIIHPGQMADVIVDELRRLQILLPSPSILEAVLRRARQQAEQLTYEVLTNGLLPDTLQGLDDLLARRPGQVATWLSWMRNAPQSPAARNILRLIERLAYIRALGLDRARADMIPALTFDRLADEGSRITPQHLGELNALRRHATLAATGIRLEESLTDATLTMFDKLLGSMARRAENRTRDKALKTVRELQGHLRTLTGSCRLLIDARSKGVDSLAQIEALDWQHFAVAVEQAEVLGRPETVDRTAELIERHRTVKLFVGAFLNAFEFRGAGAVQGLLSALAIIAELYGLSALLGHRYTVVGRTVSKPLFPELFDPEFPPDPGKIVGCHRIRFIGVISRPIFDKFEPLYDLLAPAGGRCCLARREITEHSDRLIKRFAVVPVHHLVDQLLSRFWRNIEFR